ncbi:MAG: lipopolysaccharide biosynthesis protein [Methanobrevibacter sp.]|nr:lipopolysaccharide biosynthesis protein [Methanobrevibacter sp.]
MNNIYNVTNNFIWRFFERVGAYGFRLIVELILARLLTPDDFGLIALVTVLISILNVFVDSGLGNALIQKKDADDLDFSSVFWFNIVWCIALYGLVYIIAPAFAKFYGKLQLIDVIRVLGLQIIISGVKNVQLAFVSRKMQFKRFFLSSLGGTIISAGIGIWMAYHNYGVWALVFQQVFNSLVSTIILWIIVEWRPRYLFSIKRLASLLSFGWKLLASALINTTYNEIRQLIIGKYYSSSDLAFYNRGQQIPQLFINNINTALASVLLPTMSKEQDNCERVKLITRRSIQISTYLIAPLMMGLAFVGEPLIRLLLTDKWLPAVLFMRIYCVTFMFYPIHTSNLNAITALGRSDLFLKLEIMKVIVAFAALFATMNISVEAMAYSLLFTSVASQIINSWPNWKLLNYSYIDQLKDILPTILLAVFMGGCVYLLQFLGLPDIITLILQVLLGAAIYIAGSMLFKLESFSYILEILRNMQITKRFFRNNGPDRTH